MPSDRRRPRTLLAVLVLAALVLVTLDFRQGETGPLGALQNAALAVFAPVQEGLSSVVRPIGDFFFSIGQLASLREENAALVEENAQLRERQISVADLQREIDELRALVGMREQTGFTTSAGRVIAQPPGAFRWSVLIDIGADQGVRRDMAVINAEGLVGKITEVSGGYARVQLAASPNANYAVRVAQTGQQGLLNGRGARPYELQIYDDPDQPLPDGADVVTRAFQGTAIPDGIPVGRTVVDGEAGIPGQFVDIAPAVDFNRLDLLLVVLDVPQVPVDAGGDEDEATDEPIDPDADPDTDPDATGSPSPAASG
ncbi:rod shape-determining protein MreC [soil metagenome]